MSAFKYPKTNVGIFAKAPIEGFAKTRLIPKLGAHGAAALQHHLIENAVQLAVYAHIGPVIIWCAPCATHPVFVHLRDKYSVGLRAQADGHLGNRMLRAFEIMCAQGPAMVMGTDCVAITASHVQRSAERLKVADVVTIPVDDGGYILIGMRRPLPGLFEDVRWGTPSVMSDTREKAEAARYKLDELEPLWDIDVPADYDRAVLEGKL